MAHVGWHEFRGRGAFCGAAFLALSCNRPSSAPVDAAPSVDAPAEATREGEADIRLVLWLTIDQMRGDFLELYGAHFGEGGLRRLKVNGVNFENAHYGHAITETAPGHATLFTGRAPSEHGIVGNSWMLPDGTEVESVFDAKYKLVGAGVALDSSKEGRSPKQLVGATIGDALIERTNGRAKVLSVSAKDRGAILPSGKRGQAYWLSEGGFVSSTYYREEPRAFTFEFHERHSPASYLAAGWTLLLPEEQYRNESRRSPYAPKDFGPAFPHAVIEGADPMRALSNSPFADSAVIDFALILREKEKLGEDDAADLLSLSLSATDKIGHFYGPESREMEDQMVRLDREIARLLDEVERAVGKEHLVVVLSADHGGCESAEHLKAQGKEGRRLTEGDIERATRGALRKAYGHDRYFLGVVSPYVYLTRALVEKDGHDLIQVRIRLARALEAVDGVHLAHAHGDTVPPGDLGARLLGSIFEERSGDVYVVPKRHTLFLQGESLAATHGSPWDYDTHVPVLIVAPGVEARRAKEAVDVRSLVPTVAALIGIEPPFGANFPPLSLEP